MRSQPETQPPAVTTNGAARLPRSADEQPSLSEAELRARVETTETALTHHLQSLASEFAPASFTVAGRPAPDAVRANPLLTVLVAVGLAAGVTVLLTARRKRRTPERVPAWQQALDELADRTGVSVLKERDLPKNLREALGDRTPVILVNSRIGAAAEAEEESPSALKRAILAALKTAVGFAAKSAIDMITEEAKSALAKPARADGRAEQPR